MLQDTTTVLDHVFCPQKSDCTYPFCEKIHNNTRYRSIFLDDTLSSKIIEKIAKQSKKDYIHWLTSHSLLTTEEAEALFYFQMNDCFSCGICLNLIFHISPF